MRLYPDCDYFGDKRDDELAPEDGQCESCYRHNICKKAYIKDKGILFEGCCYLQLTGGENAPYDGCKKCHDYEKCKQLKEKKSSLKK